MRDDLDPNLMAAAPEEPGEGQRYSILNCIGVGPKSDSFLCRDLLHGGREVVRRLFHEDFTGENKDLTDITLAPLAGLSHPNLVSVLGFGVEEGRAFLVREKAEGVKLSEALGSATRPQALGLIGQLLLALDYLYSQNVLHLGLKPENLFVDKTGSVWRLKVVDYGIYPVMFPPTKVESHAVGTPPYTAPEYAIRRVLDVRSDLYSVGIYLYLALAGRFPFDGKETVALLQAQLKQEPIPLAKAAPGVSAKMNSFVQRLLSRDPQSRYATPRQAWVAFYEAAEDPQLLHRVFPPGLFTDPEEVFRYQEYLKLFRRIALQGGRWAITGEKGSGKSFLARWLERLFWLNQKPVLRFPGERIALLEGEPTLNPSEPTYVLIDDADQGPAEAWLRARPYAHIVAFVQDKAWTQKKSGWQLYPLKPLDGKQVAGILERNLGLAGERIIQEWSRRTRGEAAEIVQHGRALALQGVVHPAGLHWKMEAEKYLAAPVGSVGDPFAALDEASRRLLAVLTWTQLPLTAERLSAWLQIPPEKISESLNRMLREEWVRRVLALGQEFFAARIPAPSSLKNLLVEHDVRLILEDLDRLEWHRAALEAMGNYFSAERLKDPVLVLLRARLACGAGAYSVVLKAIDAPFVQALKANQKGEAFELLGRALAAAKKSKQAEGAFKNA
jgi:hypothetical protein